MGGGILQLAAFGSQDIALVGNPQITFFRQVYKRHSPFAIESIEQTFNGTADFGRQVTATVARTGDLVTNMYLEIDLPELYSATAGVGYTFMFERGGVNDPSATQETEGPKVRWANSVGHALLKSIELEIGGFRVDKHVSEWMDIWHELSEPEERVPGFNEMIGKYDNFDVADTTGAKSSRAARTLYIPLIFFMNRHPGLALPLICLQFHETRVLFEFREWHESIVHPTHRITKATSKDPTASPLSFSAKFYVDYVYLDTEERRRFAQMSHELLIEQVQFLGDVPTNSTISEKTVVGDYYTTFNQKTDTISQKVSLNFSHPVKELVWVYQNDLVTQYTGTYAYSRTYGASTVAYTANLISNTYTYADYFNYNMKYVANSAALDATISVASPVTVFDVDYKDLTKDVFRSVRLLLNGTDRFSARKGSYFRLVNPYQHHTRVPKKKIYSYSFALSPEEHQPSGTFNMSRVDQAHFIFEFEPEVTRGRVKIFALSYNILRIASGLAGVAFSG
jgi:hypothetical protein